MALRFYYRDDEGGITEAVNRIRIPDVELSHQAEQGSVATSELPFDDSVATFAISGHRKVYAVETEIDAGTDPHAGVVWVGYTAERGVERKETRTGAERGWGIQAVDINTVLERRLLLGADCDRPAETDVQRMQWLAATTELELIDDTTYLSTASPVNMEKNSYLKQNAMAVIRDCMDQSGKNAYVLNLKTTADEYGDTNLFSLWYGRDSLETYTSDARICNIISEVEGDEDTFYPVIRTVLSRDPSRTYSGVIVEYDGGYVYVSRADTATEFAPRDTTLSAPNVHSAAQARARGRRFLADVATEEDAIRTAIQVPAAKANIVMPGHRIQVRFTHLPGYQDEYVWMRVVSRTLRILTDGLYEIDLELVSPAPAVPTLAVHGVLVNPGGPPATTPYNGTLYWTAGATPPAGYNPTATNGLIEEINDPSQWPERPMRGWKMLGDGTLDQVYLEADALYVGEGPHTITFYIRLNGTAIASQAVAMDGGLGYYSTGPVIVTADNVTVATDDELIATVSIVPPPGGNFLVPAGVGDMGYRFEINGGTLA